MTAEWDRVKRVFQSALERSPDFLAAALPRHVYPPLFNRYVPGMSFGAHVDNAIRQVPGTAHRLRTDVSATLFLSTPEEYDGGELVVEDTYGTHSVKLAAGEPGDPDTIKLLPERLRDLIDRSKKLNDQVRRLDANIYAPPLAPDKPRASNPVERQLGLLKAAFEQDGH